MPRHHRRFLHHLAANLRPLRDFVVARADSKLAEKGDEDRELVDAYNTAVQALSQRVQRRAHDDYHVVHYKPCCEGEESQS
jgi:hypothetical protein